MVSIPNNNRFICLAAALCLLAILATITATSTSTGGLRTVSSSRRRHNDRELQQQQQRKQQFANPNQPVPKPTTTTTKRPSKKPTKRPTKRPTKKPVTNPQLQQAELLCTISNTGCRQGATNINTNLNLLLPGQACPTACIEVWDPVCDCSGRQHSNICVAHSVGMSVVKRVNPNTGEC